MGAVLCYGDSNTWGYRPDGSGRFARTERWTGLLQAALGHGVEVVEEGLSGRTSAYDHPLMPHVNGLSYLPVSLASHAPLDAVVLMLGTNDLFLPSRLGANEAARGVAALVECVRSSGCGPDGREPAVLVVVPPPFGPLGIYEFESPHGVEESARFSEAFGTIAQTSSFPLLDLREVAVPSALDGVHFEVGAHRSIAAAVAKAVGELVGGAAGPVG
jgi:lysophospholipase L1-like esterase